MQFEVRCRWLLCISFIQTSNKFPFQVNENFRFFVVANFRCCWFQKTIKYDRTKLRYSILYTVGQVPFLKLRHLANSTYPLNNANSHRYLFFFFFLSLSSSSSSISSLSSATTTNQLQQLNHSQRPQNPHFKLTNH